jgi:two-component system, OmpR family, phosphate regulon sensor histidine kinase PhoR
VTLGLRGRIALTAVAASAAALVCVFLLVRPGLRQRTLDQTRQTLLAEARLTAHIVAEPLAHGAGREELDPLVDATARELGLTRITIVRADGVVVADSSVSGSDLAAVQNHAGRPEVQAAVAAGEGESIRHSATVEEDFLYVAVPIREGGRVLGVSRAAVSLEGIAAQVSELLRAVGVALALAFLITAALSAALASSLAGPLREITGAAHQYAAGNLGARIRVQRSDELGQLAQILNRSADELQRRLTENVRDRARTEAIVKAMEDGLLAVDHRGSVLVANDALRAGLGVGDPTGRHYVEALRQREVGEVVEEVLRTGERRAVEVEIRHLRRHFALIGVPFPGSEGQPHGCLLTFHDVTERHRVERIRRDFVANASHELRTPLTSIRGFVEALEDGALDEPATARRFLAKIRTHADRMTALVRDLLDLSRLESGDQTPAWSEVSPAALAAEVAGTFAEIVGRKRLALETTDAGAPTVVTDAERLRQICENLVDNAVKYTPEEGSVEIVTRPSGEGGAVIEVRDNGPGIPAEHLPRLFERFYRVDRARSRELGGTGLGLAIVRHLAESIGARVEVESETARGSCFRVTLPRGAPQTAR